MANAVFPYIYQRFLDFDLSWVLSTGCIIDTDFHEKVLLSTFGQLIGLAILGTTFVTAAHRNYDSEEARGNLRRKHMSMVLLLAFLVY